MNASSFKQVQREDSTFMLKVLELESTSNMEVWAAAEHVPASWEEVDVALYHVYHDSFDLIDARIRIKVAP